MILGVIPARGGSKGVPRKNLRMVGGKPLLAWAIECAKASRLLDDFLVSTDDNEIYRAASYLGAPLPFLRPAELAQDSSPMLPVLEHAILETEKQKGITVQYAVLIDPTAPLRTSADIDAVIEMLKKDDCDVVVSGSPAHRNPWFNMVKREGEFVSLAADISPRPLRRQDCPTVFDLNTIAWGFSRRAVIEIGERIPPRTRLYETPGIRSIDLDTELDFQLLELVMKEKLHGNS